MKVAFVEVPCPWLVRPYAQVPLGPLYLATILNKEGVVAHHCRPKSINEVSEMKDFDVIAFSGTTLEYPQVERFARRCREVIPDARIWYGGPHATCCGDLSESCFDAVGVGEAESYIVEMARDTERGRLKRRYVADEPIQDLDSIPYPDRGLIAGSHGGAIFSFGESFKGTGHENVITSRGCPWDCHFCASKVIWGERVRLRSAENVVGEIRGIVNGGCQQIRFADDNIATNPNRLFEMCESFRDFDIAWRCSVRADTLLQKEVCVAMARAGCKEVSVGIESGDQRVLDVLNKKADIVKMKAGCEMAAKCGINVRGLFMIGTPGERENTPEKNVEFIREVPFKSVTMSIYVPLPGSAVWYNPEKFQCEITSRDFSQYNKDFWIKDGDKKKMQEARVLIRNLLLSEEQQVENVRRMQEYVLHSGKANLG